jgi:hypothetical protein
MLFTHLLLLWYVTWLPLMIFPSSDHRSLSSFRKGLLPSGRGQWTQETLRFGKPDQPGLAPLSFSIFADRQLEDGKLREMADRVFYETADYDGDGKLDIMELYTAVLLFYK